MPASRIHPLADGQTLPGPRARPTAGNIAPDLECIAAAKAGCQRCSWALRKLVSLGCRPVAGHATSCEAATAAFNPHSAPPPERRFSTTGSFDYRARATPSRAAAWARRARQSNDALHYAELSIATQTRISIPRSGSPKADSRGLEVLVDARGLSRYVRPIQYCSYNRSSGSRSARAAARSTTIRPN